MFHILWFTSNPKIADESILQNTVLSKLVLLNSYRQLDSFAISWRSAPLMS